MRNWLRSGSAWLAWGLFGVVVILMLGDAAHIVAGRAAYDNVFALLDPLGWRLGGIAFAFVGALIVTRQPHNTIGWLLLVPALAAAYDAAASWAFSGLTTAPAAPSALFLIAVGLEGIIWLPLIFPVFFVLLLFPTGRPLTPRWRLVIGFGLGMCAFFVALTPFAAELAIGDLVIPNPIGFLPEDRFPMGLWSAGVVLFVLAAAFSLFLRYRRAGQVERKQIKWLLYACALFVSIFVPGFWLSDAQPPVVNIWGDTVALAFLTIPVAIAIAILRYRLWEIDVIIRKTLVYAALTAFLGLVYAGSVILLQQLFEATSGQQSPLAIVLSTLIAAALFTPLRRWVQEAVDRRFFRSKVDATAALAAFGAAARDETDLEALLARLADVVQETLQPDQISLHLEVPGKGAPSDE